VTKQAKSFLPIDNDGASSCDIASRRERFHDRVAGDLEWA
jgi:hypothetical protein